MIRVKGFNYHNDYHRPVFTREYENIGQFMAAIKKEAMGKKYIIMPAHKDDWSFDQKFAGSMCACLRYSTEYCSDGAVNTMGIELITDENEKILFSSGALTDGKGYISESAKKAMSMLEEWSKSKYEFADEPAKTEEEDGVKALCDTIDVSLPNSYKVLEGDKDTLYVVNRKTGIHYSIKISECNDD